MTRVLVTGAGGFIGSHVLRAMPDDWEVIALSTRPAPVAARAEWVTFDSFEDVPRQVTAGTFDAVVHLAGNADHGLAVREPWRDVQATAVLGARLLSAVRTRRIVMLSSAAVYAGLVGPVGPELPVQPAMPYALSKLYLEGFVRSRVADGAADTAAIIRLYNAFGPGERPTRLVPAVVAAMQTGASFRLTGAADSLSDPIHVDDVAAALVAAATSDASGTWDLCGGDPHPLVEQVARIAHALQGASPSVDLVPDPSQTPILFHSDPRPLADALAIPPPRPFEAGVQAYGREAGWLPADIAR